MKKTLQSTLATPEHKGDKAEGFDLSSIGTQVGSEIDDILADQGIIMECSGFERTRHITEDYKVGNLIGIGAFSRVKLAQRKSDGEMVALKIIKKSNLSSLEIKQAMKESKMIDDLQHPNIVGLRDFYNKEKYCCIVMEYMQRDLYDYVVRDYDKLTEDDIRDIFR